MIIPYKYQKLLASMLNLNASAVSYVASMNLFGKKLASRTLLECNVSKFQFFHLITDTSDIDIFCKAVFDGLIAGGLAQSSINISCQQLENLGLCSVFEKSGLVVSTGGYYEPFIVKESVVIVISSKLIPSVLQALLSDFSNYHSDSLGNEKLQRVVVVTP